MSGPGPDAATRGRMTWSSTITAHDAHGHLSADAAVQMGQAFANARSLLQRHGCSPDEVGSVVVYISDQSLRPFINDGWTDLFQTEPRPARRTTACELPPGELVQLQLVAVRGASRREVTVAGLAHRDPIPVAVVLDPLVFSSGLTGQDPATGQFGAGAGEQIQLVLANLRRVAEAAGGSLDDVTHTWVFMRDRAHQQMLVDEWLRAYPHDGERPARKTVRYDLAGDQFFQAQAVGLLGPRRNLEIPGVGHHDPIPMAAVSGPLLMSSGLGGYEPSTGRLALGFEAQTKLAVENLDRLCGIAGGRLSDVGHITVMVRRFEERTEVERQLQAALGGNMPSLHFTTLGLPADEMQVQLHAAAWIN